MNNIDNCDLSHSSNNISYMNQFSNNNMSFDKSAPLKNDMFIDNNENADIPDNNNFDLQDKLNNSNIIDNNENNLTNINLNNNCEPHAYNKSNSSRLISEKQYKNYIIYKIDDDKNKFKDKLDNSNLNKSNISEMDHRYNQIKSKHILTTGNNHNHIKRRLSSKKKIKNKASEKKKIKNELPIRRSNSVGRKEIKNKFPKKRTKSVGLSNSVNGNELKIKKMSHKSTRQSTEPGEHCNENGNYKYYINQMKDLIDMKNYEYNPNLILNSLNFLENSIKVYIKKIDEYNESYIEEQKKEIENLKNENQMLSNKVKQIKDLLG